MVFGVFHHVLGFVDELADIAEFAVDGGETDEGDGVNATEEAA